MTIYTEFGKNIFSLNLNITYLKEKIILEKGGMQKSIPTHPSLRQTVARGA